MISVKLKLIQQVVTPEGSPMLTDGRTNGRTEDMCHTIIRPTFIGHIKNTITYSNQ